MSVALVIPVLDEAKALPALVERLAALDPPPADILMVDGGSADASIAIARVAGWRVIESERGRAVQINAGVAQARGDLVCVLHGDTLPPSDMVAVIEETLADRRIALKAGSSARSIRVLLPSAVGSSSVETNSSGSHGWTH